MRALLPQTQLNPDQSLPQTPHVYFGWLEPAEAWIPHGFFASLTQLLQGSNQILYLKAEVIEPATLI
jgi:hypothetical protein